MSNLFGNQNFPKKEDEKDSATRTTPASAGTTAGAERPPLFPVRDPAKTDTGSLFQSRTPDAGAARAPLFPKREETPTSPFAARTTPAAPVAPATTQARAPLFPSREPAAPKPMFGTTGTGGTTGTAGIGGTGGLTGTTSFGAAAGTTGITQPQTRPMFGTTPAEPAKPMFGARPATDPAKPMFGTRPAAEPAKPMFGTRPAAEPAKPMFGARPAAEPTKPMFGAKPAAPARPMFSANPAEPTKTAFGRPSPSSPSAGVGGGNSGDIKITDAEFILLRDFLYDAAGIYIAENRKYLLENRLASRLRDLGLRSFGEYHKYLKFDANKDEERNIFFINMTTNETSFFRNGPQLDVFRDKVLKKVIDEQRAKGQKKLRIWSAGCSSGEEPYTLAMIIYEVLGAEVPSWDIRITANDLSLAMLDAAKRGLYNDYAIRTTSPEMLSKYFTKEGNLYRVDPKLTKLISFGQINLNDKVQLSKVEKSQIVFCRNVIIYFDDEMKKGVINAFYDNLLPGGYLLIGHSESLHNISRAFKPEHYAGSIVYCKQS